MEICQRKQLGPIEVSLSMIYLTEILLLSTSWLCLLFGTSSGENQVATTASRQTRRHESCFLCPGGPTLAIPNPRANIVELLSTDFLRDHFPESQTFVRCLTLADFAFGGCWNTSVCQELRTTLESTCCFADPSDLVDHSQMVQPSNSCPSIKNVTQCYENVGTTTATPTLATTNNDNDENLENKVCVSKNGPESTCEAKVLMSESGNNNNSATQSTCQHCQVGDSGKQVYFSCYSGESFALDCRNVRSEWDDLRVCGEKLYVHNKDSSNKHSSSPSQNTMDSNRTKIRPPLKLIVWLLFLVLILPAALWLRAVRAFDNNDNNFGRRLQRQYNINAELELT